MIRVDPTAKIVSRTLNSIRSSGEVYDPTPVIEAILLQFPLPLVLLDTGPNVNVVLVGGNIVESIRDFINGVSTLIGLRFKHEYEGMTFSELPRYEQRRIEEYELRFACIAPGTSLEDIETVAEIYQTVNRERGEV